MRREVDSLFYYLNLTTDITKIPTSKDPALRNLQLCNLQLMKIIDKLFHKHGITYWLDCGTALGAYRHNGFIPWDDDMDIAIIRDDYHKAILILKDELKDLPFQIEVDANCPLGRFGVGYKHELTGVWCDIFPMETYYSDEPRLAAEEKLKQQIEIYRIFYHKNKNCLKEEDIISKKKEILFKHSIGSVPYFFYGPEFQHKWLPLFPQYLTTPVQRHIYDSAEFDVPANLYEYLKIKYGFDFMTYPRSGLSHHGSEQGSITQWAKNNNVDMSIVLNELSSIYSSL